MILRRATRLVVGVVLLVVVLGSSASGAPVTLPSVDWIVQDIAANGATYESEPSLDGNLLAWVSGQTVRVWNLRTLGLRTIPMKVGSTSQAWPDVSGDYVVYAELDIDGNWDIRRYSWSTNSTSEVVGTAANEQYPRVDGNWVLWEQPTTGDVYSRNYDVGGHTSRQEIDAGTSKYYWDVDNERLFAGDTTADVLRMRQLRPVSNLQVLRTFADNITGIEAHGTRVAVELTNAGGDSDVWVYNLQTHNLSAAATSDTSDEFTASIFDSTVAWTSRGSVEGIGYDLLDVPVILTPTFGTAELDSLPSLYGHRCAFAHSDAGDDFDVALATSDTKLADRTSGDNRYATAAAVSRAYFADALNVVLCNGLNFPDALSAAPLAKALDAPLLLTEPDALSAETLTEIQRLGPAKIWIIGGTTAVSGDIYEQLDVAYSVERVYGTDRYSTSAAIARELASTLGAGEVDRGFFARGDTFPDALAVGPVAAAANGPILLVETDRIPTVIASAVDDMNLTMGYVIGGTSAIDADAENDIRALIIANGAVGTVSERWSGTNRYATACDIVENGLAKRWIDLDTAGFATGTNFPDALGGGAALGYYGSPLLLTDGSSLSDSTSTFLYDHRYEIGRIDAFGGTNAISADVYNAILSKVP